MRSVITLVGGILITATATCSHAQGQPGKAPGAAPGSAPVATSQKAPGIATASGTGAKPAGKARVKTVSKKHSTATSSTGTTGVEGETQQGRPGRRDPFESLVNRQKALSDASKNLPPGKGGLQIGTLRVDGIVHSPNGMIGVVSNPQQRTYFLREGDQLYDGRVDKIAMDGISFHEMGKDTFGKPVERQVNKRIYSTAGEQQ